MRIVQKYGGTSLADPERIMAAAKRAARLAGQGHEIVVVVSAQGHTTDELIQQAGAINRRRANREIKLLREKHNGE